jgi:hypothetical protein
MNWDFGVGIGVGEVVDCRFAIWGWDLGVGEIVDCRLPVCECVIR